MLGWVTRNAVPSRVATTRQRRHLRVRPALQTPRRQSYLGTTDQLETFTMNRSRHIDFRLDHDPYRTQLMHRYVLDFEPTLVDATDVLLGEVECTLFVEYVHGTNDGRWCSDRRDITGARTIGAARSDQYQTENHGRPRPATHSAMIRTSNGAAQGAGRQTRSGSVMYRSPSSVRPGTPSPSTCARHRTGH